MNSSLVHFLTIIIFIVLGCFIFSVFLSTMLSIVIKNAIEFYFSKKEEYVDKSLKMQNFSKYNEEGDYGQTQ